MQVNICIIPMNSTKETREKGATSVRWTTESNHTQTTCECSICVALVWDDHGQWQAQQPVTSNQQPATTEKHGWKNGLTNWSWNVSLKIMLPFAMFFTWLRGQADHDDKIDFHCKCRTLNIEHPDTIVGRLFLSTSHTYGHRIYSVRSTKRQQIVIMAGCCLGSTKCKRITNNKRKKSTRISFIYKHFDALLRKNCEFIA